METKDDNGNIKDIYVYCAWAKGKRLTERQMGEEEEGSGRFEKATTNCNCTYDNAMLSANWNDILRVKGMR